MTTTVYRRAGSIFFLCRFHPLEQGAQWVLILVSRYRRFFADSHSDTVSLTHIRRCGTVFGKEPKNSGSSGNRTRNPCGFFYACTFLRREGGSHTTPCKGESCPPSTSGFLASRHPQVRRLGTSPCGHPMK
ncbi:hypothetical protein PRA13_02795 [Xylella fastidiosa]|uniref:hypothetical protein n=1 Tax=Xylella fastidiosa TaxID=2371 RepID=UPI001F4E40EC|nr:hypothetical protein [Xylella fastidiosa]MDC7962749.1 hypothetical protein [Xylella fastidiosa]